MSDILIFDGKNGDVFQRDYSPEELAQRKVDEKAAKDQAKQQAAEEARQAGVRAAAIAHAKTLGFTDDMIAVMYPGLGGDV
jgi:hypothetical protein